MGVILHTHTVGHGGVFSKIKLQSVFHFRVFFFCWYVSRRHYPLVS